MIRDAFNRMKAIRFYFSTCKAFGLDSTTSSRLLKNYESISFLLFTLLKTLVQFHLISCRMHFIAYSINLLKLLLFLSVRACIVLQNVYVGKKGYREETP